MATRDGVLLAVLVLGIGCAGPDDTPAGAEVGADNTTVDAIFASWDRPDSPGCALAVARDGELVYTRGYGYANLDYDIRSRRRRSSTSPR